MAATASLLTGNGQVRDERGGSDGDAAYGMVEFFFGGLLWFV